MNVCARIRLSAVSLPFWLFTTIPIPLEAGEFTFTQDMGTARAAHTATLLPNGKVLVAGGDNASVFFTSAEIYDPAAGTFAATGMMSVPRAFHTATLLQNGRVLIVGGGNSGGGSLASAELYDPSTEFFTPTGSMGTARSTHTATLLPNGKVLIAGGYNPLTGVTATAELYDPVTNAFGPTGGMSIDRASHTATLLPSGKVLIAGGVGAGVESQSESFTRVTAEIYDPASGTFTPTDSMTTPREIQTATLLGNGKVLVAGGAEILAGFFYYQGSAELYDPTAGTFSATDNMTTPRALHVASPLPDGTVLVAGGDTFCGSNGTGCSVVTPTAEIFDPISNTFTLTGNLNTARDRMTATLLPGGAVLIAGGASAPVFLSSAELYLGPSNVNQEIPIFSGGIKGGVNHFAAEPSIAVDPLNSFHAVVGFNEFIGDPNTNGGWQLTSCSWAETFDGGATWPSHGSLSFPPVPPKQSPWQPAGDPWVRFGIQGELFYSCMAKQPLPGSRILPPPFPQANLEKTGVFVATSATGSAAQLGAAQPVTTPSVANQGQEIEDHPALTVLKVLKNGVGRSRLVVCWTDYLHSSSQNVISLLNVAYSDDGLTWTTLPVPLAGGVNTTNVSNAPVLCNLGGNATEGIVTWLQGGYLWSRSSMDGITWLSPQLVSQAGSGVNVIDCSPCVPFSTTKWADSEAYALVIPGTTNPEILWQMRLNSGISQVFLGSSGQPVGDINVEKFLPGAGECNVLAGAYEVVANGQYRYTLWNLNNLQGPPVFTSTVALDPHNGYLNGHDGRRVGDYTGVACTATGGLAVWTDTRSTATHGPQPGIWGVRIPLPLN